jgi:protoporphyrinogen oxidase
MEGGVRVGIIGGGITGLTVAYYLARKGCSVTLFEKEPELGGQVRTVSVGGERVEGFYHHIFAGDTNLIGMTEELGLSSDLEWLPSRVGYFSEGRAYPFSTPLDLLRFKPLSLYDRLRVGMTSLRLQRRTHWRDLAEVTASEWLPPRTGGKGYRVIFDPLLRGKFGDYAGDISMAWLWSRFRVRLGSRGRAMQRERLGYLRGSFHRLVEALAEAIREMGGNIFVDNPVRRLAIQGDRIGEVELRDMSLSFDAVVATVSSPTFLSLVAGVPDDYRRKLEATPYLSALCLVLALSRQFMPFYWLNTGGAMPFVAVVEHTNLVPAERYSGKHLLYISNYMTPDSPLTGINAAGLLEHYLPHLRQISLEFDPAWVEEYHLFRECAAQPVVNTGYEDRMPGLRTPIDGLYLANTAQIYPEDRGMNYSVRLGLKVSGMVLEAWKGDQ